MERVGKFEGLKGFESLKAGKIGEEVGMAPLKKRGAFNAPRLNSIILPLPWQACCRTSQHRCRAIRILRFLLMRSSRKR